MGVRREVMALTTSAGGAATGSIRLKGYVGAIRVKGFDGSADIVVAGPGALPILTKTAIDADETFYPRTPVHGVADGAAISGGFGPVLLCNDDVSVTIANGGNAQAGTIFFDMVD